MDDFDPQSQLHRDARSWFTVKQIKGETPRVAVGGLLDGLEYYLVEIEGRTYWLTDSGLFDPPASVERSEVSSGGC